MLLPFLSIFMVFGLFPITWSARLAFTEYHGIQKNPPVYVGTDNFRNILSLHWEELPKEIDEATGEQIYKCGRERVIESEARVRMAAGEECKARMMTPRDVLPNKYSEFKRFNIGGKVYVLGATDKRFWQALYNTVLYTLGGVTLTTISGLFLAIMLQKQSRLHMLLRVVFFLPSVTSGVAITAVWRWIFSNESFGLANTVFNFLGMQRTDFLSSQDWTMRILIWLALWGGMGFPMILFLAGLKNIPVELYEAAAIDGANVPQRFRHITLPLLRPTFVYVVVMGTIGAFQVFDVVYILFSTTHNIGGVLDSALTVVTYLYDQGFNELQLGYASAIAWVLFFVIFIMTMISLRVGRVNESVY
jgi:multiple sugar transport system permease protein